MRKIRDILRLKFAGELSIRQIHRSTKVSVGAIQKLLARASELELSWPLPDDMDDSELARRFYPVTVHFQTYLPFNKDCFSSGLYLS